MSLSFSIIGTVMGAKLAPNDWRNVSQTASKLARSLSISLTKMLRGMFNSLSHAQNLAACDLMLSTALTSMSALSTARTTCFDSAKKSGYPAVSSK